MYLKRQLKIAFFLFFLLTANTFASDLIWLEQDNTYEWQGYTITVKGTDYSENKCNIDISGQEKWMFLRDTEISGNITVELMDTIEVYSDDGTYALCEIHLDTIKGKTYDDPKDKSVITVPGIQNAVVGEEAVYPIIIENLGTNERPYVLSLTNADFATYWFDPSEIMFIEPGKTKTVYLYLTPESYAEEGINLFSLNIETEQDYKEIELEINVTGELDEFNENNEELEQKVKTVLIIIFIILFIFIILSAVGLVIWILMLIDCIQREFNHKFLWLLIINIIPFGAIFYYFMVKREDERNKENRRPIDSLALLSFIFGLVAFIGSISFGIMLGIPAIIAGVVAKNNLNSSKSSGRELAKTAIVLGILGILFQILLILFYVFFIILMVSINNFD